MIDRSDQIRCSSTLRRWRVISSRAPNGSSSNSTSGSVTSERAIAARWRIPPDSCAGRARSNPARPTRSISAATLVPRCPLAGDLQRQSHVALDGAPGQQGWILEGDAQPAGAAQHRRCRAVDGDLAARRLLEVGEDAQHGRLAAARRAEQGDELAA